MRVLIYAPSFYPSVKAGGPARSVSNLARLVAKNDDVWVIASDRDVGETVPFDIASSGTVEIFGAAVRYVDMGSIWELAKAIRQVSASRFDVVMLNSIWSVGGSFIPAVALLLGHPRAGQVVLAPRGELEPGALALKSAKKRLAGRLVRAVYARVASGIAVTSDSEARNARSWFPELPILRTTNLPDPIDFGYIEGEAGVVRLLFLGRVHTTKGLLELAEALHLVHSQVHLSVVGPIQDQRYWAQCCEALDGLPTNVTWEYLGQAARETLQEILWNSDLMATITRGENFGHTIAEALQAGCPVLATDKTPWTELLRAGGGWVVDSHDDRQGIAAAVDAAGSAIQANPVGVRRRARSAFDEWQAHAPGNAIELAAGIEAGRRHSSSLT